MPSTAIQHPLPASSAPRLMRERLDEYLPGLQSDRARRTFLRKMEAKVAEAYGKYLRTGSHTLDASFGVRDEFDYSLILLDISKRLSALNVAEVA